MLCSNHLKKDLRLSLSSDDAEQKKAASTDTGCLSTGRSKQQALPNTISTVACRLTGQVLRPADVDCSASPEWQKFRLAAAEHSRILWGGGLQEQKSVAFCEEWLA